MNEELNRDARAFVVGARGAHEPAPGAKDRVREGLIATLGLGPAAPASPRAASSSPGSWITGAKLAGVLAVVSVGAGLLLARSPAKTAADAPSALVSAPVALHPRVPGVTGPVGASAPAATASSVTLAASRGAPVARAALATVDAPLVKVTDLPTASPAAAPSPPALARQGEASASPASLATSPSIAAPEPGSLSAEVALLRRMSAALRGHDPKGALKAVAEHARRFPNGALAEEREVERIVALCALGRREDAARATDRFTRAYPASSHEARIRAECAPALDGTP